MNILRKPFRYTFFRAAFMLVLANTAVHFLLGLLGAGKSYLGLNVVGFVYRHYVWQLFTYMFVHGDITHLLFNMIALAIFGTALERAVGSKEFLLMYFSVGVLSGLFSVIVYFLLGRMQLRLGFQPYYFYVSLVGASGAIYGLLFAYAVVFPRSVIFIWGIIPLPAPLMVLIYALIEFGSQFLSSSNVAHMTHLAGFAFAWLYFIVRMGVHPVQVWKDAYRR